MTTSRDPLPPSLSTSSTPVLAALAAHPKSSRESSPAPRPHPRHQPAASRGFRSRKNSHDHSPSRPPSITGLSPNVPSAAAIQRALSAQSTPPLQPSNHPDVSLPAIPKLSRLPRSAAASSTSLSNSHSNGNANHSHNTTTATTTTTTTNSTPDSTPHWPLPPRLRSPPPTNPTSSTLNTTSSSRRNSLLSQHVRRPDPQAHPPLVSPTIVVQPPSTPTLAAVKSNGDSEPEEAAPLTMKPSGRGPSGAVHPKLETVAESSLPATPGFGATEAPNFHPPDRLDERFGNLTKITKQGESESESGGNHSDDKRKPSSKHDTDVDATPKPKNLSTKSSRSTLVPRARTGTETSTNNMTVETETVNSIPQAPIGTTTDRATGRPDAGSLRLKPSTETIRPKKDRKKATRKAPSITSGTASTKADIFEAKVASAVDEAANSSDSDETFVYESNPPDPQPRRSRHHSRTPSATSMASLGPETRRAVHDTHRVAGKRSMKFTNNPYSNATNPDNDDMDRSSGTVRGANSRAAGNNSMHHHHIGRHGRGGVGPTSLFDHDSPFMLRGVVGRSAANASIQSSRPTSPRFSNHSRTPSSAIKKGEFSNSYDMDGDGADDERTPLMGTVRTRPRGSIRRPNSASLRQLDYYQRRRRSWLARFAGCVVLAIMLLLLIFGAVGFLFATTKPLYMVNVKEIQNVLASEQELMLDLLVEAVNPNVIAVTVWDMDVNIFAKSKHVGSEKWWREHGSLPPVSTISNNRRTFRRDPLSADQPVSDAPIRTDEAGSWDDPWDGDDPFDDPFFPDPSKDSSTMLLGRIFHFDSALTFDGSPLKRHLHESIGELRLAKPGNKTEIGGTERWERVLKYSFELIIRGVLKYQLPLSSRTHTAAIGASILVEPEKGVDKDGKMTISKVQKTWWVDEEKKKNNNQKEQDSALLLPQLTVDAAEKSGLNDKKQKDASTPT